MIRRVNEVASMRDFEGHILFVEGYDVTLARALVSGVDVWLNNPIFPLEASGTSGMKAGFNGVMNLSVLDGWWGEGYRGDNGWAIKPAPETLTDLRRNTEESRSLYELLQDRVVPLYYDRGPMGFSPEWIHMAKRSISTLLPRFNSYRMVGEYLTRFYAPASGRGQQFSDGNYATARSLADWKRRIRAAWAYVQLRPIELPQRHAGFGNRVRFEVGLKLNGLRPEDVTVELMMDNTLRELAAVRPTQSFIFQPLGERDANGENRFVLEISPDLTGKLEYRIRAYPSNPALSHRFEMGLMKWV
jgi:starch phosphorylase